MFKLRNLKPSRLLSEKGHTLLSTAMAIVGLGLVTITGAQVFDIYKQQNSLIENDAALQVVKDSLDQYVDLNGRLPCPASTAADVNTSEFGVSVGGASGCETGDFVGVTTTSGKDGERVLIGAIPTRTLNLSDDSAADSDGSRFFYAVTTSYTGSDADFSSEQGDITILDENGDSMTSTEGNAVYAVMTSGDEEQDFNNATFTVASQSSCATCDTETNFTDSVYYMASNDVYQWKIGYGECTCPTKTRPPVVECYRIPGGFGGTDDGGGNGGGEAPLPQLVNDSFCPQPKPTPEPKDCSAEPEVNDCFGWYEPPLGACPCGTEIEIDATCNERSGNGGTIIIANVSEPIQCDREGDIEPDPNPRRISCGECVPEDSSDDSSTDNSDEGGNNDEPFSDDDSDDGTQDPLALDLDGDGVIEFRAINEGTLFDVNNDGEVDYSSWIGSGDGLLAEDRNGNGIIDGQAELFGNEQILAFEHLAMHDSNDNGVIDPADDNYGEIIVWQDENSDGISQASEMKSLDDWDIVSIDLGHDDVDEIEGTQQITGRGVFTRVLDTGEKVVSATVEFFLNMFNPNDDV